MGTSRSTLGVIVAVAATLLGALVPAGAADCPLCTRGELVLLGIAAAGAAIGVLVALEDRSWPRRLLPALGAGVVSSALVVALRIAI